MVIPPHNKEKYADTKAQIIVSANRCTDKTVEIAEKFISL